MSEIRMQYEGLGSRETQPGLGSRQTQPNGVEGASMVRRAPFPLSSLPVYVEHSMKLLCVCVKRSLANICTLNQLRERRDCSEP